jgi:uncharacterized phage-associated protein
VFVSHHREKLLNAIVYFVKNTKYCNTLKLFKLLNFLDFEHYRQTGRSATGLTYVAWKKGPVPDDLWREIQKPKDDLSEAVEITEHRDEITNELERREFKPKIKFNSRYFTKRELAIMERLADYFKELRADQISRFSHSKKLPWEIVYRGEGKPAADIPYDLALSTTPIIHDMPTIDQEELNYRRTSLAEIEAHTK